MHDRTNPFAAPQPTPDPDADGVRVAWFRGLRLGAFLALLCVHAAMLLLFVADRHRYMLIIALSVAFMAMLLVFFWPVRRRT